MAMFLIVLFAICMGLTFVGVYIAGHLREQNRKASTITYFVSMVVFLIFYAVSGFTFMQAGKAEYCPEHEELVEPAEEMCDVLCDVLDDECDSLAYKNLYPDETVLVLDVSGSM